MNTQVCPYRAFKTKSRLRLPIYSEVQTPEVRPPLIQTFCHRPETVAEGILELITDTSKVGHVMTVTNEKGRRYIHLLGDPKSKL